MREARVELGDGQEVSAEIVTRTTLLDRERIVARIHGSYWGLEKRIGLRDNRFTVTWKEPRS